VAPGAGQNGVVRTFGSPAGPVVARDDDLARRSGHRTPAAKIGSSLVNATFRGVAGARSQTMPLAGALIASALLSHSLRPAVAGSAREVRALAREVRAAGGARYGH